MQNQWCIDIRYGPRSGDFDMPSSNPLCFSTQPGRGVVGMSWIGTLLISSCITIAFLNMLLHTKLNNSQMYFRDIPIDYHDLCNKCLSLQVMYCCKGTMSIVLKSCLGTLVSFFCTCKED